MSRLLARVGLLLALATPLYAQGTTNVTATDTATGARHQVGDNTNKAVRVNVVAGSSGCLTGTDNGTVAGAQVPCISINLSHIWDGTNWKRLTGLSNNTAAPVALSSLSVLAALANTSAPSYTDGRLVFLSSDVSGSIRVNCTTGCGGGTGGTAIADRAAFTYGTTQFTPIGGVFNSAITALTSGQAGAVALTTARKAHVALFDANDVALTTTAAALDINIKSGGSTTVTEAATITANQANAALTSAVLYGFDGTTDSRLRTRAGIVSSGDVGLVTRPFPASDGTNTQPTMDAAARAGFQKVTDGTNTVIVDPCQGQTKSFANIQETAGAQIITGTSAKRIWVCSLNLVTATAQNIAVVAGTGTVCATTTVAVPGLGGGATAATGWNLAANGGLTFGSGGFSIAKTTVDADNLCVLQSGAGQVSGGISYVVQ